MNDVYYFTSQVSLLLKIFFFVKENDFLQKKCYTLGTQCHYNDVGLSHVVFW